MPWTVSDVEDFKSGLNDDEKEQWVAVANDALERCLDDGGDTGECEASAIRQANAVVGEGAVPSQLRVNVDGERVIIEDLLDCWRKQGAQEAATLKSRIQGLLRTVEALMGDREVPQAIAKELADLRGAMLRTWSDLSDEVKQGNPMSHESAREDINVPEDQESLREPNLDGTGPVYGVGRGLGYCDVPSGTLSFSDLDDMLSAQAQAEQRSTLTDAYQQILRNIVYAPDEEVPDKASAIQAETDEFVRRLGMAPEVEATEGLTELAEGATGEILGLEEVEEAGANGDKPPLVYVDLAVIEPGWGNERDNHYYSREMLQRHAKAFKGASMFATEHRKDEKGVRTEVSQIVECPVRFTESGAPVARAAVYMPWFEHVVRQREQAGTLGDLQCSIHAYGKVSEYEEGERKGKSVDDITEVDSVDWVRRAGAGGRALSMFEESENNGGSEMTEEVHSDEEERDENLEEGVTEELHEDGGQEATESQPLTAARILEVLVEADLPKPAMKRLAAREYTSEDELGEAVEDEKAYLHALRESEPRPEGRSAAFGLGRQESREEAGPRRLTPDEESAILAEAGMIPRRRE